MSHGSPSTAQVESIVLGLFEQAKYIREPPRNNDLSSSSRAIVLVLDSLPQGLGESLVQELSKELGQECIYKEVPNFSTPDTDWKAPIVGLLQRFPSGWTAFKYIRQIRQVQSLWGAAEAASFMDTVAKLNCHDTGRLFDYPNLHASFRKVFDSNSGDSSTIHLPHQSILMPASTGATSFRSVGHPLRSHEFPTQTDPANIPCQKSTARTFEVHCSFGCKIPYKKRRGLREHMIHKHNMNVTEASVKAEEAFSCEHHNTSVQATLPTTSTDAHQNHLFDETGNGILRDYHQPDNQQLMDPLGFDNNDFDLSIDPILVDDNGVSPFSLPSPLAGQRFAFE